MIFCCVFLGTVGWYFIHLGRAEHRARRRARGLPEPNLQWSTRVPLRPLDGTPLEGT